MFPDEAALQFIDQRVPERFSEGKRTWIKPQQPFLALW